MRAYNCTTPKWTKRHCVLVIYGRARVFTIYIILYKSQMHNNINVQRYNNIIWYYCARRGMKPSLFFYCCFSFAFFLILLVTTRNFAPVVHIYIYIRIQRRPIYYMLSMCVYYTDVYAHCSRSTAEIPFDRQTNKRLEASSCPSVCLGLGIRYILLFNRIKS